MLATLQAFLLQQPSNETRVTATNEIAPTLPSRTLLEVENRDRGHGNEEKLSMQVTTAERKRLQRSKVVLRFGASLWLLGRVFEISLSRAVDEFTLSLHTWVVLPWESPIIEACYCGDLSTVRDLLASGQASARTISADNGWSLLHVSSAEEL